MKNIHCKQIWIMTFLVFVFLALASTAFAQSVEIRFFPNGTVNSYSSPVNDRVSDVYKSLELVPSGKG
ncbi:MAG: hypothetical protein K0Q87_2810, partial [Neobacillus sp.]|nr:hypothetical protein [Neobacillus sp.]